MNEKEKLIDTLGYPGHMISASKSAYCKNYPKNFVLFNANICTKNNKIWYGDLDLTITKDKLIKLAIELNQDLYIFYEHDCRFEKECNFDINDSAVIFYATGAFEIGEKCKSYYKL